MIAEHGPVTKVTAVVGFPAGDCAGRFGSIPQPRVGEDLPMPAPRLARAVKVAALAILLGACTTNVYEDDVASFKTSVDDSVAALDALRVEARTSHSNRIEAALAAEGAKLEPVGDCTGVVTDRLQRDSRCLALWARHRALPEDQRGAAPNCPEPARDPDDSELLFYDLSTVAEAEESACQLGVRIGDSVTAEALGVEPLLANTALLGAGLQDYAAALVEIADAGDSAELRSTVAEAKAALEKTAGTVAKAAGEPVPGQDAIGPVSDLLGSALLTTLEVRRFRAMRRLVGQADPVVERAAKLLSRNSMPLMIPKLRTAGTDYLRATEVFNDRPTGAQWDRALGDARRAQQHYLALYEGHPSATFAAMAGAHAALKEALEDPSTQFDAMKAAIKEFAARAKATRAIFAEE